MNQKKHRDYYEGILQLRNPTKDVVGFAKDMVRKNEGVFIAREEKVRGGRDLYLSSQKLLQVIGRELQNRFGGEYKISRKLFTVKRQTGKRVYRVTVLFRLPDYKVGDIVKTRGKLMKVTSMGRKVFGKNIETGKKMIVDYKHIS